MLRRSTSVCLVQGERRQEAVVAFEKGVCSNFGIVSHKLTSSTYQDIQAELDDTVNQADDEDVQFNLHRMQQAFGYAIFQLVAAREKLAAKNAIPPVL